MVYFDSVLLLHFRQIKYTSEINSWIFTLFTSVCVLNLLLDR